MHNLPNNSLGLICRIIKDYHHEFCTGRLYVYLNIPLVIGRESTDRQTTCIYLDNYIKMGTNARLVFHWSTYTYIHTVRNVLEIFIMNKNLISVLRIHKLWHIHIKLHVIPKSCID